MDSEQQENNLRRLSAYSELAKPPFREENPDLPGEEPQLLRGHLEDYVSRGQVNVLILLQLVWWLPQVCGLVSFGRQPFWLVEIPASLAEESRLKLNGVDPSTSPSHLHTSLRMYLPNWPQS